MEKHVDLDWLLTKLAERAENYARYREYYDGEQPLQFATSKWKRAFGTLFDTFAYNRCARVVDAHADAVRVEGWDAERPEAEAQGAPRAGEVAVEDPVLAKAEAVARQVWEANSLPARHGQVAVEAFTLGDAYVIVWPSTQPGGLPLVYPQLGDRCMIRYSAEFPDQPEVGCKVWQENTKHWRCNVYYPTRVERYRTRQRPTSMPTRSGAFEPLEQAEGGGQAGYPWGEGFPLFGLHNNAPLGDYGVSELRDVLGLQDALNKLLADMLITSEAQAFPQRWAVGIEPQLNRETNEYELPFKPAADQLWWTVNELAKFGQFNPADIVAFVTVQDGLDTKISRATQVPPHWLGVAGQFPSGEALRMAERPWTVKLSDRALQHGDFWEAVIGHASGLVLGQPPQLRARMRELAYSSDTERWDLAAKKLAAGVPEPMVWRELGYSEAEIKQMEDARQANATAMARAFNGGLFAGDSTTGATSGTGTEQGAGGTAAA